MSEQSFRRDVTMSRVLAARDERWTASVPALMLDHPSPANPHPKYGVIFSYHECRRCLATWSESEPRSPECASGHPLLCCGATPNEVVHKRGCEKDPMFQAGVRCAMEREKAFLDAFVAWEEFPIGGPDLDDVQPDVQVDASI